MAADPHHLCIKDAPSDGAEWPAFAREALAKDGAVRELSLHRCCLTAGWLRALAPALQRLTGLKSLDLSWSAELDAEGWGILAAEVLPYYGGLESLHLAECRLSAAGLRAAAPGLRGLAGLRALRLEGNRELEAKGWSVLAREVLPSYKRLEALDVAYCGLTTAKLRALVPGLKHLALLRELRLWHNGDIDAEGWGVLAQEVFPSYTRLEVLNVEWCSLTAAKLRAAAPGLGRLRALRELRLGLNAGVDEEGWGVLAREVLPAYACLELLAIGNCGLTAEKLRAAAPALAGLAELRELHLEGNAEIDAEGWGLLALEVLPKCPLLETLDLRRCGLSAAKLRAAAPGLASLPALLELRLGGNQDIEPEGWATLAREACPLHAGLQTLSLYECGLTTARLRAACPGLQRLKALRELNLGLNKDIEVEGWSLLAQDVFPFHECLEALKLNDCSLTTPKLRAAAPGLGRLTALRELHLRGLRALDAEGWGVLAQEVFPRLVVLEDMYLSKCALTAAKLRAAAAGLRALAALRRLRMWDNEDIDAEGWGVLAEEVLPHLPRLEELNVSGCGPAAAAARPALERQGLLVSTQG